MKRILLTLDERDRRGVTWALGFEDRWKEFKAGATDRQLLEHAGRHLGLGGGCCGPKSTPVDYKGGPKPFLLIRPGYVERSHRRSRRIAGSDLAQLIRELFNIPHPTSRRSLFEAVDG